MILVIDNYDSFTYNLVQYVGMCGVQVEVRRNDAISVEQIEALAPAGIVLSPGPCTPKESSVSLKLAQRALRPGSRWSIPILGVCLGHQAIGEAAGGTVRRAGRIIHGKSSRVRHDGLGVFRGVANPLVAGRYHSLVVARESPPVGFVISAEAEEDGEIMAIRHEALPIEGVQFHPESVLTGDGMRLIANFVESTA
ncbi:MAG: aminodeoxychorismate/anthranilate synthase component II [Fimbriimonas ginsengisoli]|uniref:Aminodeoxychorismate/anthranilate synthase component II n=1 Tax=Fimbriimonas ginsengisoli TaxID=1005039 RepID=A0A931PVH8_FIMGI|nr:aminodeoxychorismate/anthranilate synthase component II [Fimbriimonas ginsengisoli]